MEGLQGEAKEIVYVVMAMGSHRRFLSRRMTCYFAGQTESLERSKSQSWFTSKVQF